MSGAAVGDGDESQCGTPLRVIAQQAAAVILGIIRVCSQDEHAQVRIRHRQISRYLSLLRGQYSLYPRAD